MAYLEEDHQQYWETNLFLYNEELESLGWDKTQQQSSNSSQDSLLPSFNPPIKQRGQNRQQMAYLEEDHQQYWETNLFLHNEELESLGCEEPFSGYYDSSSPDGTSSSMVAKSILSERNRRQNLNKRLFALRSLIPNISKMDKASIIKDAIQYIQQLHEEEKVLQAEINQPELERLKNPISDIQLDTEILSTRKKQRILSPSPSSSIDVLELKVTYMGERTLLVSLTCERKTDTMVRLCEVFEALNLKIITANITFLSGSLLKTIFVEGDENEKDHLKMKIETTIAALSGPESPMSFMSF